MNFNKFYIIFLAFFTINNLNAQLQWPFVNSGIQAKITGSTGEFRQSNGGPRRFHKGIDVTNGNDLSVHSINSGVITYSNTGSAWDSYVRVGSTYYYHILASSNILSGTKTTANIGDYLGEMITANIDEHLHLQENNTNFLDNNIFPFIDNSIIEFRTNFITDGATFYRNGITHNNLTLEFTQSVNIQGNEYTMLYNKVDIVAHANDFKVWPNGSSAGGQLAPYQINWNVLDYSNTTYVNGNLTFNVVPNNNAANNCFHPSSVSPGNPSIHIITAHPTTTPYDRYWNTSLRQGVTENWSSSSSLESRYNLEAQTKDDIYHVNFNAFDVDFDNNPNHNASNPVVRNILIDNFRPYIKKVEIRKNNINGTIIYSGDWNWVGTGLALNQNNSGSIGSSDNVYIKIFTSEPMRNVNLAVSSLGYSNNNTTALANSNNTQWEFLIPSSSNFGTHVLSIQGLDYANNPLQQDASQIPIRQDATTWIPTPISGTDTYHQFTIYDPTIDIGPVSLSVPASSGIFSSNEQVFVRVKNFGANTIDFGTTPVFTTIDITGPINEFHTGIEFTGSLPAGAQQDFLVVTTANLSLPGVYNFKIKTNNSNDNVSSNDEINVTVTSIAAQGVNANFQANVNNIITGSSINFNDQSTGGATSWQWSFLGGTPSTSTAQNPQNIVYNTPGCYDVTLTATNSNGSDAETKYCYVSVSNTSNLIEIDCSVSDPLPFFGTSVTHYGQVISGTPPYNYRFIFGDGSPDYVINNSYNQFQQTSHIYQNGGTYSYGLLVTDNSGYQSACYNNISVNGGVLNTNFTMNGSSADQITVQTGTSINFVDITTGGSQPYSQWVWEFEPEMLSGALPQTYNGNLFQIVTSLPGNPSGNVFFNAQGTYKVRLTVNDGNWYSGVIEKTITVIDNVPPTPSSFSIDNLYLLDAPCYKGLGIPIDFGITTSGAHYFYDNPNPPFLYDDWYPSALFPNNDGKLVLPSNTIFPYTVNVTVRVTENYVVNWPYLNYKEKSMTITINDGNMNIETGGNITMCSGLPYPLGGSPTVSGGTPPYIYNWFGADISDLSSVNTSNPIVTPSSLGIKNYYLSVTDANGCQKATNFISVEAKALNVDAGSDKNICVNSTNQSIGTSVSGGTPPYSYSWSPEIDLTCTNCVNPTVSPSNSGSIPYSLTVTDALGCSAQDNIVVNAGVSNPIATISPNNTAYCEGTSVTFYGTASNSTGLPTYQWSTGTTNPNLTLHTYSPIPTNPITLTVTDPNTGCFDIKFIDVAPRPNVSLTSNFSYNNYTCGGTPIVLGNYGSGVSISGGTPPYSYLWVDVDGSNEINDPTLLHPTITPTKTVHYQLFVTDLNGCSHFSPLESYFINSSIPEADFEVGGLGTCVDGVNFINTTNTNWTGIGINILALSYADPTSYSWSFGIGAIPASSISNPTIINSTGYPAIKNPPPVSYNSVGTKTITLTATNPCGSSIKQKDMIMSSPIAIPQTHHLCGNSFQPIITAVNIVTGPDIFCQSNDPVEILNGANVNLLATNNISLTNRFKVEAGSHFNARIENFCHSVIPGSGKVSIDEDLQTNTDGSKILNENKVGIGSYDVLINPNPTKEKIKVTFPNDEATSIIIYNSLGGIVYSNSIVITETEIDMSSYPKGIFILKSMSGNNVSIQKIVKN